MSRFTGRYAGSAVLAAAVALASGCSQPPANPPDLHPLSGTVTRDGKGVAGGGLIFLSLTGRAGLIVNANVEPGGAFTAQTEWTGGRGREVRQGVPVGRYKAVYHPVSDGSKMGLEFELPEPVEVKPGENTVTLVLPSAVPESKSLPRDDHDPPEKK